MSGRTLWLGWVGLIIFVMTAFGMILRQQGISRQFTELEKQREVLEKDYQIAEDNLKQDLERYVKVIKRFPWLLETGSGTAFLARLSEVAADHMLEIQGVGPLEQMSNGHVERIGRKVQLSGSFSDIVGVVEKVERNRGIMEGLKVQQVSARGQKKSEQKLQAEFSLVTVELSQTVRKRIRSLLPSDLDSNEPVNAAGPAVFGSREKFETAFLRDPFLTVDIPKEEPEPTAEQSKKIYQPFPKVRLSGIVSLLGKRMAIINNQMVGAGDHVNGVLVERVTDDEVILKSEFEGKSIRLPAIMSNGPAN